MQPQRRNLLRSLADDEIQIIGLEFTINFNGGYNQELAMFSPQGLIIPRRRTLAPYHGNDGYQPNITFHTTDGDFTMRDYGACPW